jgi:hypothetical protein
VSGPDAVVLARLESNRWYHGCKATRLALRGKLRGKFHEKLSATRCAGSCIRSVCTIHTVHYVHIVHYRP